MASSIFDWFMSKGTATQPADRLESNLRQPLFSAELAASTEHYQNELSSLKRQIEQLSDSRFDQIQKPKLEAEANKVSNRIQYLLNRQSDSSEVDGMMRRLFDELPKYTTLGSRRDKYILVQSNFRGFDVVISWVYSLVAESAFSRGVSPENMFHNHLLFIRYENHSYTLVYPIDDQWRPERTASLPMYDENHNDIRWQDDFLVEPYEVIDELSADQLIDAIASGFNDWFGVMISRPAK